ncbi:MAG: hypothetical protein ABEI96_03810 [Haloarculaceae archaeon]
MDLLSSERGQAVQIGAVLLFAVLVITFATYQAFIIPQQTQEIEFKHSKAVQNDMLELRNKILDAKQTGNREFSEVKLGTRYPNRLFAINPPPAGGTLHTGETAPIQVEADGSVPDLCPSKGTIQTRNLTYTDGYNAYRNAPKIVYENTVLYLKFDGKTILLTDEQLVQGSNVNVVPLNTSYSENGVDATSVEPIPGNVKTAELDNANVSFPTGLSEDKWEQLLEEDDIPPENITVDNGRLELNTTGQISVSCSPVGLGQVPAGGQRAGAGVSINPAGPNDVEIRAFNRPTNDVVEVTFNNTGTTDANVTEARMAFYNNQNDQGGTIGPIDLIDQHGTTVLSMKVLGPTEPLDPEINFPGNDTETTITFENTGGEKLAKEDFFVVRFVFDNGKEGTYFVDVPA